MNDHKKIKAKFELRVKRSNKNGECWGWDGSTDQTGYGRIWRNGNSTGAHRISWILAYGEIPLGMYVLHKCGNPSCTNPRHLYLNETSSPNSDVNRRIGRRRLQIDIPEKIHEQLKKEANSRHVTFTKHMIRILLSHVSSQKA